MSTKAIIGIVVLLAVVLGIWFYVQSGSLTVTDTGLSENSTTTIDSITPSAEEMVGGTSTDNPSMVDDNY